jgi:prepilin-type N-terminal cleavage/methylation domain-containing protein
MKSKKHQAGFTLIELLMVIAIIGILAGILIPTVGAVRKQANIAASKAQLSNYVTAIQMFKGDYGYYPLVSGTSDSDNFELNSVGSSTSFIQTLSGRNPDGSVISSSVAKSTGNRRKESYHSFSKSEFFIDDTDVVAVDQIADRFNNINISIEIDTDGDGFVKPSPTQNPPSNPIRTPVTAYVDADEGISAPSYTLWD